MNTGTPGALGSAGPAPSKGAGELAGLLAEVKELTPEHLRKIEQAVKDFHAARDGADNKLQEAQARIDAAETKEVELGKREHEHVTRVNSDLANLNNRETNLVHRENDVKVRENDVTAREKVVSDAERRIARVRENIDSVGDAA